MTTAVLISTLDLIHHPENASLYAVELLARTIPTTYSSAGIIPTPAGMQNRLLRLVKATLVPIPEDLAESAAELIRDTIRIHGRVADGHLLVRVILRSQQNPRAVSMYCQFVTEKLLGIVRRHVSRPSTAKFEIE